MAVGTAYRIAGVRSASPSCRDRSASRLTNRRCRTSALGVCTISCSHPTLRFGQTDNARARPCWSSRRLRPIQRAPSSFQSKVRQLLFRMSLYPRVSCAALALLLGLANASAAQEAQVWFGIAPLSAPSATPVFTLNVVESPKRPAPTMPSVTVVETPLGPRMSNLALKLPPITIADTAVASQLGDQTLPRTFSSSPWAGSAVKRPMRGLSFSTAGPTPVSFHFGPARRQFAPAAVEQRARCGGANDGSHFQQGTVGNASRACSCGLEDGTEQRGNGHSRRREPACVVGQRCRRRRNRTTWLGSARRCRCRRALEWSGSRNKLAARHVAGQCIQCRRCRVARSRDRPWPRAVHPRHDHFDPGQLVSPRERANQYRHDGKIRSASPTIAFR